VNGTLIRQMVLDTIITPMVAGILDTGRVINPMVLDMKLGLIVQGTSEHTALVERMDLVNTSGKMDLNM